MCNTMSTFKFDSFVRPFRGKGDNLAAFWSKFLVLGELHKWDSEEKQMAHLPLLLDGSAFLVFDQLSAEDQKKTVAVKAALEAAFAPSPAESYHLFVGRQLALDEPVNTYVADLKRLLTL